jgi:hypothetical protein
MAKKKTAKKTKKTAKKKARLDLNQRAASILRQITG